MDGIIDTFEAGEKVMYPQFGLGTITGVTSKQVSGASFNFYRLEFPLKQMEILVPVKRATENGLRRVMSRGEVDGLLEYIASDVTPPRPQQWHRWRKKTLEQLKSGDPMEIAKIYRYLQSLEGTKGLSFTERKILLQVERMLVTEIAVAKQISEARAEKLVGSHGENGTGVSTNGSADGSKNGSAVGKSVSNGNGKAPPKSTAKVAAKVAPKTTSKVSATKRKATLTGAVAGRVNGKANGKAAASR